MDVAQEVKALVEGHLARIEALAAYARTAQQANEGDVTEWHRSLIRAFADLSDESSQAERELSENAKTHKHLTPTEIAKAAKISTAALYKRRPTAGK